MGFAKCYFVTLKAMLHGILLLSVYFTLCGMIYLFVKNKSHTKSLIVILLLGFILRAFICTDMYLHEWDERFHAVVSKNIMTHPLKPTLYENPVLDYDYQN